VKINRKINKFLSLVAGILASGTAVFAQTTSYSDVVGYTTTVIKGSSSGTSGSYFNFVPVQLSKPAVFTGQATASGTTITLAGASLASLTSPHYLIIQSGTGSGYLSDITANTSTSVTTSDDLSSQVGSGALVSVIPHVLLTDVLGTGAGLVLSGGAAGTADLVYLVGTDGSFKSYYYKTGLGAGWKDAGTGSAANSVVVYPNESILVERKASTDTAGVVQTGMVLPSDAKTVYTPGFNTASSGYPTALNLTALTSVLQGGSAATADQIYLVDPSSGSLKAFYYKTGLGAGWKDASSGVAADITEDIGSGFVVERKQGTSAVLSQTKPF
jgi:hypothetical protein